MKITSREKYQLYSDTGAYSDGYGMGWNDQLMIEHHFKLWYNTGAYSDGHITFDTVHNELVLLLVKSVRMTIVMLHYC